MRLARRYYRAGRDNSRTHVLAIGAAGQPAHVAQAGGWHLNRLV
ncbi:hypothetical protein SALB1_2894 [Salinisphaera sp. LB1]|nr:hypothetical protein SALB1_2894 [Salinisphaera sp. LB1]